MLILMVKQWHKTRLCRYLLFYRRIRLALDESEKALSLATVRRDTLLQRARTLQISTSSDSGEYIEWGVAPFIRRNNLFYIYVSELGGHVRFMLDKRPVLFSIIEDENLRKDLVKKGFKNVQKYNDIERYNLMLELFN